MDAGARNAAPRALRVGLLVDRADELRGGAERALFQLARFLVRRGHSVLGFALEVPPIGADAGVWERVAAPRGLGRGARERRLGRALVAAARRAECDVTVGVRHVTGVDVLWLHGGSHAASVTALRSARAGRELAPRAFAPWSRHRTFLALERAALTGDVEEHGARRVVCVSRLVEEELLRAYPAARARLVRIENGVELARFQPRERAASGAELRRALGLDPALPLVGLAARQPLLKGFPVLARALAELPDAPWQCVLAGPRDAERWREVARACGLPLERVRVVEHVEPVAFAAACDLAVLPTWRDTCGLFVLEALACGTPVITTARAGTAELLFDAGTVLARPGDTAELAVALRSELARVVRGVDRERVRARVAHLDLDRQLGALEAQLREVVAEKRACKAAT